MAFIDISYRLAAKATCTNRKPGREFPFDELKPSCLSKRENEKKTFCGKVFRVRVFTVFQLVFGKQPPPPFC